MWTRTSGTGSLFLVVDLGVERSAEAEQDRTQTELTAELQRFQAGTRANNAQDVLWALYNKVDFVFNY